MQKLFLLAFFLVTCASGEVNEEKCISDFLQSFKEKTSELAPACDIVINKHKGKFNESLAIQLSRFSSEATDKDCMISNMFKSRIDDLYLRGVLSHLNNKSDDAEFEKSAKFSLLIMTEYAHSACKKEEEFGNAFKGDFFTNNKLRDTNFALCRLKLGIENNLFKAEDYKINYELMNAANCTEIYLEFSEEIDVNEKGPFITFGLRNVKAMECLNEVLFGEKWMLKQQVCYALSSLELTEQQKVELRQKFIESERETNKGTLACMSRILL